MAVDGSKVKPDEALRLEAVRAFSVLAASAGALGIAVALLNWRSPIDGYNSAVLTVQGVYGLAISVVLRVYPRAISWPVIHAFLFSSVAALVMLQVYFIGPRSFAPVSLLWIILFVFGYLPRRQALCHTVWALIGMTTIFVLQPGWPNPVGFAVFLGGSFMVTAWFVVQLVGRAEAHAESERRAHAELAVLNATLEARVTEQVDELSRLDRLRRFLSPSIAEAIVSTDGPSRLAPHRSQIAAVFCDLRGFTAFSSEAEPEDVTALLGRFHDVIGPLVDRYEATVGGFAGDGVALYFNDPIPCPDPAVRAVRLALDLEGPMGQLSNEWRQLGFEVGYGVGIALGYATLGVIGIEHRREYTAIGTVMNLASRLSDEAGPSEILLDQRAASAVQHEFAMEPTQDLQLKGFSRPVPAYRVVSTIA